MKQAVRGARHSGGAISRPLSTTGCFSSGHGAQAHRWHMSAVLMRVCGCASCSGACPEHRTAQRATSQCPADTSTHESNWFASVTSSNSPPSPSSRHEPAHRAPASPSTRSFRRTVSGCAPSRECTPIESVNNRISQQLPTQPAPHGASPLPRARSTRAHPRPRTTFPPRTARRAFSPKRGEGRAGRQWHTHPPTHSPTASATVGQRRGGARHPRRGAAGRGAAPPERSTGLSLRAESATAPATERQSRGTTTKPKRSTKDLVWDAACPLSTRGGTRLIRLVRERRGGGGGTNDPPGVRGSAGAGAPAAARGVSRIAARRAGREAPRGGPRGTARTDARPAACPISTG